MVLQDWCLCSAKTQVPSLAPAHWVKILALRQLQCRSKLWLGSNPWPRNSICCGAVKKKKKKKKKEKKKRKKKEKIEVLVKRKN